MRVRGFISIILALSLLLEACFLGRLPLGIETSFADGSSKSWRFLRGPDASGTLEGAGGARGVLAVLKDASSWKAVAADTLGNVLALAGTNGDFTRRTFDPWGNPLTRDASGSLRAATLQERRADYDDLPLAWASQEYDPDTGLSHYHFREYSPSLGGWLTTDPIGLAGGYLNLRSYLGNRPTDMLDKDGTFAPLVAGLIGAGIGAIAYGAIGYYKTGTLEGTLKGAGKGALVFGVAGLTMGAGAMVLGAEAATVAGAALIGGTSGAAAQVTDNLYEGVPVGEGVTEATAIGAATGGMFQASGNAVARAYNPYGPLPKMVPPNRATPQQAAENTASKQSAAAAEGAQISSARLKAIEDIKLKHPPCLDNEKSTTTRFIDGVKVTDRVTGNVLKGTVDLKPTLDRISSGQSFPHQNDGSIFHNRPLPGKMTPELPPQVPGYYREYVHPTPGLNGPGPQRIVIGQGGEMYYTPDHYESFIPIHSR